VKIAPLRPGLALLTILLLLGLALPAPAHAAGTGSLGINVTARYTGGHTGPLAGALVTAHNLDSGLMYPVSAYGDPATSAHYQALNLPFGRYRLRIERSGFATVYWPRQFSPDAAAVVTFGESPGCNPADAATCDVHILTAELPQLATVSGTVRTRGGDAVAGASVTAVRDDEPAFHPTATTGPGGTYTLQIPPGAYTLRTPNGNSTSTAGVQVTGTAVRDLTLLDPPGPPRAVHAAPGSRQAAVSWTPPADDGGADITSYTVTAQPGGATCATAALSCTLTGLDNGQVYRITVVATNRIGTGPSPIPATLVEVSSGVPRPPGNVRVSPADRALDVTWSASPSDNVVEYTAIATPGGKSCSTTGLSCTIPKLRNGRAYTVSVTARSQAGSSTPTSAPHPVAPAGLPGAPRDIQLTARPAALLVEWRVPLDDGGHRITEYVATAWPGGRTCHSSRTRCIIRGLRSTTDYSVTVRASTSAGTGAISPGSEPTRPLPGPGTPPRVTGLTVRRHAGQLTAKWHRAKRANAYWVRVTGRAGTTGPWSVVHRTRASFAATPHARAVQVRAVGPGGRGPISEAEIGWR